MKLIRNNIFETNSSSTHSLVLCMASDVEDWKNGKKYYNEDHFVNIGDELNDCIKKKLLMLKTKYIKDDNGVYIKTFEGKPFNSYEDIYTEENMAKITNEEIQNYMNNREDLWDKPITYDEYFQQAENGGYETFEQTLTTPNGETVVALGYYGNDY